MTVIDIFVEAYQNWAPYRKMLTIKRDGGLVRIKYQKVDIGVVYDNGKAVKYHDPEAFRNG